MTDFDMKWSVKFHSGPSVETKALIYSHDFLSEISKMPLKIEQVIF